MISIRIATASAAFIVVAALTSEAEAETWKITSLAWQPFSGPDLEKQGAGINALREALATVGVELEVEFMPWRRAKAVAGADEEYVGYYPSWPSEVEEGFFGSEVVFTSPVGFAQRADDPISWEEPADLTAYEVATVGAYIYPDAFQALLDDGTVSASEVNDDAAALQMVNGGRVDAAAIDRHVMAYNLQTHPGLAGASDSITFHDNILVDYDLVIAFDERPENRERAELLKEALGNVDTQTLIDDYLAGLER